MSEYCLFGARTLADLLERLGAQHEAVRAGEDVECLHRMRVATRRLREALPLFGECLSSSESERQRWARSVKRLTRALRTARDLDVQIDAVVRERDAAGPRTRERPGFERLLLRLRQSRSALQKGIRKALARFKADGAADAMRERIRTLLGRSYIETRKEEGAEHKSIRLPVLEAVKTRVADAMSFDGPVRNPRNVAELHEMRKAFKRLRYALELFAPLYEDKLEEQVKSIKAMQDILGELHDCDVWLEFLPRFIEEETERTRAYHGSTHGMSRLRPGLDRLYETKSKTRAARYDAFLTAWDAMCEMRWWEKLLSAVSKEGAD